MTFSIVVLTARELVHALRGKSYAQYGIARCPAHNDHTPSLSISESDGMVLVRCHAGCSQDAVIDALRARGLWGGSPDGRETIRWELEVRHRVDFDSVVPLPDSQIGESGCGK